MKFEQHRPVFTWEFTIKKLLCIVPNPQSTYHVTLVTEIGAATAYILRSPNRYKQTTM